MIDDLEMPHPGVGEVLVQVHAAGVGPWDAWIRSGRSVLPQPLPLTLGSDLSGVVVEVGAGVDSFAVGQAVFGVTNKQFTGAYAEYAVATATMIAPKPASLDHVHSAGVPVVAVTALQMLVDLAKVKPRQRVLVLGAGGNVGAYAVQLALLVGAHVIGADVGRRLEYVRGMGAHELIDTAATPLAPAITNIDVVVDTVGGDLAISAVAVMAAGGILISSVGKPPHQRSDVRADFMLVDVTTDALRTIAGNIERGRLVTQLGSVLPLAEARTAHQMLAGIVPHPPGKLVLSTSR